jgi:thioredoxin-like negative regulator of GroEL
MKKIAIIGATIVSIISSVASAQSLNTVDRPEQLKGVPSSLVMIFADWCSTCQEQKKVISKLIQQDKYKHIKLYSVNFDKQKNSLQHFNASMQSTLIGYKDGKEVERITGETKLAPIQKILDKTL